MSSGGGGTNTVTQNSAPPPQVMAAYQNVVDQAQNVASQPLQQYQGQIVAGFTPDQQSAFNTINNAQGIANPFINAASSSYAAATQPLWSSVQPFTPTGITATAPQQFSPGAISQYESPYTQQVVASTQAEFANQNATQAAQLTGNAVSQGAFGGDRAAVAQSTLANQQQLAQAPVIAGLENQGYAQALQEFNTQQQTGLQASAQQMQAQTTTNQQMQAEQQMQLGANEANSWLNSQAAAGYGALGQEALGTTLQGASAQLQSGALQQQLGQEQLNVPYEQFLQQQAYPFQTTNFLAGITSGTGSLMGGSSTSNGTSTPSALSTGVGLGAAGLGAYGLASSAGWLGGASTAMPLTLTAAGSAASDALMAAPSMSGGIISAAALGASHGGAIPVRRTGGGIAGNDNWHSEPTRATGTHGLGIAAFAPGGSVPLLNTGNVSVSMTPGHVSSPPQLPVAGGAPTGIAGAVQPPQLPVTGGTAPTAIGSSGAGMSPELSSYYAGLQAGMMTPAAIAASGYHAPAAAAPAAATPDASAAAPIQQFAGGGEGSGGGGMRRGGIVARRADGGDTGDDQPDWVRRQAAALGLPDWVASTPAALRALGIGGGGTKPAERDEDAAPAPIAPHTVDRHDEAAAANAPPSGIAAHTVDRHDEAAAANAPPPVALPNPTQDAALTRAGLGSATDAPPAGGIAAPLPAPETAPAPRSLSGTAQLVAQTARTLGVDPTLALTTAQIESGMGTSPDAPGSSNTGLFQLGPSERAKYGGGDGSLQSEAVLGVRNLADEQKVANAAVGGTAAPWQTYIVHQQGIGGGPALLRADPNADAAATLVANTAEWRQKGYAAALAEIRNNIPADLRAKVGPNPTVGQFLSAWQTKYASIERQFTGAAPGNSAPSPTGNPTPSPTGNPAPPSGISPNLVAQVPADQMPHPAGIAAHPSTTISDADLPTFTSHGAEIRQQAPWLALLATGLGTLGGHSTNGLANIGEGGLAGLKMYEGEQQRATGEDEKAVDVATRAKTLQNSIEQARARIAHEDEQTALERTRIGQTGAYQTSELAQHKAELDQRTASDAARQREADARLAEEARQHTAQQQEWTARDQLAAERIQNTQTYRDATIALRKQGLSDAQVRARLAEAVSGAKTIVNAGAMNGKPVDYDTALKASLGSNDQVAPPAPTRQAAPAAPKPGDVQQGYRFKGGDPASPNSWEQIAKP